MMVAALRWTCRLWWRDRRLPAVLAILVGFGGLAIGLDTVRSASNERDRRAAETLDATTFESQGARNPHSVAHFSRVAFRPRLASAGLDTGISDYAGTSVWLEAHVQDPAGSRAAEDRLDLGRFADLDLAWVGQVIVPLLVVMLGFDAIAGERRRQNLQLLVVTGASLGAIVRLRALSILVVVAGTFGAIAIAAQLLPPSGAMPPPDGGLRVALWLGSHTVYLASWVALTIGASLLIRSRRSALLVLLGIWVASTVVVPRVSATPAAELAPIPSAMAMQTAIARDIEAGFDAHAPSEAREKELERRVLAEYGVSRKEDLKISFAGLALQEGERFGNLVYDTHYGALAARYEQQCDLRRFAAFFGPLVALRQASTAAAGTDVAHQLDFTQQAETQRRSIIDTLNDDMILHGAGKDFEYLADPSLWRRIPRFHYTPPAVAVSKLFPDLAILAAWLAIAVFGLAATARRASRQVGA